MSLGKKIKAVRLKHKLSQEELAQKLNVSRQAITKWELDKGMPDIDNLKTIAIIFDVRIDDLLLEETPLNKIIEKINLEMYPAGKGNGLKEDYVVLEKFPDASSIVELYRKAHMSKKEKVADFLVMPGLQETLDHWRDPSKYYLVEKHRSYYLVQVTKDYISSIKLNQKIIEKAFQYNENTYTKTPRRLK